MWPLFLLLVASAQGLEGPQTNEQTFIYPNAQVDSKDIKYVDSSIENCFAVSLKIEVDHNIFFFKNFF